MAAELFPVAGARIYMGGQISTKATDFVLNDFAGESWLEIDGFETMGAIGDEATIISTDLINRGRTVKQKGTANAGSMQCNFAVLGTDPGQIALINASLGGNKRNYAFKIVFADAPDAGTPSERYFVGIVTSAREQGGQANTIMMMQATIEVNSNIVAVAAA